MAEIKKEAFFRRWFGGLGWRAYLQALPFSIGMLVLPLVPTVALVYLLRQGQAPVAGALILLLTFGYPLLRARRPRAAWWVGTLVALGSLPGLIAANVAVGLFFGAYLAVAWALTIVFVVLNWKRLRPWTFAVLAAVILGYFFSMEIFRSLLALAGFGLMALYFRLPDRENFPRAPLVVSVLMALLLTHGAWFYFDVGGKEEVSNHPATYKIFEYSGQRRGWAGMVGVNPRFLVPSCKGDKFFIGAKFSWTSGLLMVDPTSNRRKNLSLPGGVSDNLAQDCRTRTLVVGDAGANEIYAVSAVNPDKVLLKEKFDGARIGLLRLDRKNNRLYMIAGNKDYLYQLRASNLAENSRIEFSSSPTDLALDRPRDHAVVLVTAGGEVARVGGQPFKKQTSVNLDFGKLIYNLALDEKNRRLYLTSLLGREIRVLDADTLATIGSLPIRRGGRYMQYDQRRDLLYVANFFFGTVSAYSFDGHQWREAWSLKVGRRVRYLALDHLRDQLCFTSLTGGYCLGLEALSPAPKTATPETEAEAEDGAPAVTPEPTPADPTPEE